MSTPRQILAAAYSRSKANKGSADIDEGTEGLRIVQDALNHFYTITARVKKEFFMVRVAVDLVGGKWALPENVERMEKLWTPAGVEVRRVPWDNRTLHAGRKPAVYFMGRAYYPAGNLGDPTSGQLIFTYAPTAPTVTIDQSLVGIWPSAHEGFLTDECAVYLALKDRRVDAELQQLKEERDGKARLYIAHLDHVNAGEESRTGVIQRLPGAIMPDILALLAGNGIPAGEGV